MIKNKYRLITALVLALILWVNATPSICLAAAAGFSEIGDNQAETIQIDQVDADQGPIITASAFTLDSSKINSDFQGNSDFILPAIIIFMAGCFLFLMAQIKPLALQPILIWQRKYPIR